jgi:prepilin signal peptidase PulO-like enzyme (type II secretory pathway)
MLIELIIVGAIGLLAGGVSNALADDLPYYRFPRLPRYPDATPRPMSAWLGITAFALGQRESPGGARLSWRYPLTEIATAATMIATLLTTNDLVDSMEAPAIRGLQLVFWLAYMAIFVLLTVIDVEHKLILFSVSIPTIALAVLDALLTEYKPDLSSAVSGGAIGFGTFFVLYLGGILYAYLRGIKDVAFGYGDVILITLSGLILGPESLIFAMFLTVFLGFIGSMTWIIGRSLSGKGHSLFTALPYGPYIIGGTIIMMLFSSEVRAVMGY